LCGRVSGVDKGQWRGRPHALPPCGPRALPCGPVHPGQIECRPRCGPHAACGACESWCGGRGHHCTSRRRPIPAQLRACVVCGEPTPRRQAHRETVPRCRRAVSCAPPGALSLPLAVRRCAPWQQGLERGREHEVPLPVVAQWGWPARVPAPPGSRWRWRWRCPWRPHPGWTRAQLEASPGIGGTYFNNTAGMSYAHFNCLLPTARHDCTD
jgi:hypothetical protein